MDDTRRIWMIRHVPYVKYELEGAYKELEVIAAMHELVVLVRQYS